MSTPVMDAPAVTEKASAPAAVRPRRDVRPAIGKGSRGRRAAGADGKMFRSSAGTNGCHIPALEGGVLRIWV
jgi:hypothetical protein